MSLTMYRYGRRDRVAAALLAWVLRYVASERYRRTAAGAMWRGLDGAAALRPAGRHAAGTREPERTT
jgi:hypothetical protein